MDLWSNACGVPSGLWELERDGNSLEVLVKRRNGIHVGMEEARRAVESTPLILCDGE